MTEEILSFKGLTFSKIVGMVPNSEQVLFYTTCGRVFIMYHERDCCETVDLADVNGDVGDLVDNPILVANARTETGNDGKWGDTYTWTFYNIGTIKGTVQLRWVGTSNGYYSEEVTVKELSKDELGYVENGYKL